MNNLKSKDLSVSMDLEFDYKSLEIIKDELHRRGLLTYKWNGKDIKTLDDNHLMNVYNFIERKLKQSIKRNYERERFYDALESYYSNRDY